MRMVSLRYLERSCQHLHGTLTTDVNTPDLPSGLRIVIVDAPPLHGIRQRVQQLASRFSAIATSLNGEVWYFDEPGNIVTVFISPEKPLSNLWSWMKGPVRDPETGIVHFIPPAGLPFGYHVPSINNWNHAWDRITLGGRYRKSAGPVVLIIANVLGLGWLGALGEDIAIYDCADEISEFKQASLKRDAVLAQERNLMSRVNAVVTTSQRLYDSKAPYSKRIELIRNAADIEHFRRAESPGPKPASISNLTKPIVGFYGFLADWLDWPLIEAVVRDGVEFDWLFMGPTTRDLSYLRKYPNYHQLGKVAYADLPIYLSHFSCAHIPFARTPLTLNVNPVKLYEYLAGGVPVVATPLPELEPFRDVCEIADTPDSYLSAIRKSIASDTLEKRAARSLRVSTETWDNRVGVYLNLISELLR
jgi:hypothetical protein